MLHEVVHYDDLARMPNSVTLISNMEIRGYHAMFSYWKNDDRTLVNSHPGNIQGKEFESFTEREDWYRYLNSVRKTDTQVEDYLHHTTSSIMQAPATTEGDRRLLEDLGTLLDRALAIADELMESPESITFANPGVHYVKAVGTKIDLPLTILTQQGRAEHDELRSLWNKLNILNQKVIPIREIVLGER